MIKYHVLRVQDSFSQLRVAVLKVQVGGALGLWLGLGVLQVLQHYLKLVGVLQVLQEVVPRILLFA